MVTWLITSRDHKRSRSWPQNLWSSISQQPCEVHGRFILTTNMTTPWESSGHMTDDVTWPERSKSWPQYLWSLISLKPCEIDGPFKLTTYMKLHIASAMITWQMHDVTWPERSRSWPQYLWGLISQLLCEVDGGFKLNTYGKPYIASPMVTWPMTSRHVTSKVNVVTHNSRDSQYLWGTITVQIRRLVQNDHT